MSEFLRQWRHEENGSSQERRLIRMAETPEETGRAKQNIEATKRAMDLLPLLKALDTDGAIKIQLEKTMAMKEGEDQLEAMKNYSNAVLAKMALSLGTTVDGKTIDKDNISKWKKLLPTEREHMIAIGLMTGVISIDALNVSRREADRKADPAAAEKPEKEGEKVSDDSSKTKELAEKYIGIVEAQKRGAYGYSGTEKMALLQELRRRDPYMAENVLRTLRGGGIKRGPVRDARGRTGSEARAEMDRERMFGGRSPAERRAMSGGVLARDPLFRSSIGSVARARIDEKEVEIARSKRLLAAMGITGDDDHDSRGFSRGAMREGRYAPRSLRSYASTVDRDYYPSSNFRPFGQGEGEQYRTRQQKLTESYADKNWDAVQGAMKRGEYAKFADDPAYASIMNVYGHAHARWINNPGRRYGDIKWFQTQIRELEKRYQHRTMMRNMLKYGSVLERYGVRKENGYGPDDSVNIRYTASDGTARTFRYSPYYEMGQATEPNMTQWEDFRDAAGIVIEKNYYHSSTYETMSYSRPRVKGLTFTFTKPGVFAIDDHMVSVQNAPRIPEIPKPKIKPGPSSSSDGDSRTV